MSITASGGSIYTREYGIHRWWTCGPYDHRMDGCYFLVCKNTELFILQQNYTPHVACIVDDFGNLVRKP